MRFCNIAAMVLFSLVLVAPALVFACEKMGVTLPPWATSETATYFAGGAKTANVGANANPAGFASKEFQSAVDVELENRIPFKAGAMLGYAGLQRLCMALADVPFDYECYPSYFGSSRLHIPAQEAVTYLPAKRSESQLEAMRRFGDGLAQAAERWPDKRFVACVVQGYQTPAVNPAYELMSDPVVPQELADAVVEGVAGTDGVHVVSLGYSSLDEYYCDFFRTDHHWNFRGAERAYAEIADRLQLAPCPGSDALAVEGYLYTGATARWGLDPLVEQVDVANVDFSSLVVNRPDGASAPYGHDAFYGNTSLYKKHGFYDYYYDCVPGGSMVAGGGEGQALLICNSYGGGILPYIAQNYAETRNFGYLHPAGRDAALRIDDLVRRCSADDVFFVGNAGDIAGFMGACPNFFDEA